MWTLQERERRITRKSALVGRMAPAVAHSLGVKERSCRNGIATPYSGAFNRSPGQYFEQTINIIISTYSVYVIFIIMHLIHMSLFHSIPYYITGGALEVAWARSSKHFPHLLSQSYLCMRRLNRRPIVSVVLNIRTKKRIESHSDHKTLCAKSLWHLNLLPSKICLKRGCKLETQHINKYQADSLVTLCYFAVTTWLRNT